MEKNTISIESEESIEHETSYQKTGYCMQNGKRKRINVYIKKSELEKVVKKFKREETQEEKIINNSVTESESESESKSESEINEKFSNLNIELSEKFLEWKKKIKKVTKKVRKIKYKIINENELLNSVVNKIIGIKKIRNNIYVYIDCIKNGFEKQIKCLVDRELFKKHFPYKLLEFYESKAVFE